jgi:hypothetical protein
LFLKYSYPYKLLLRVTLPAFLFFAWGIPFASQAQEMHSRPASDNDARTMQLLDRFDPRVSFSMQQAGVNGTNPFDSIPGKVFQKGKTSLSVLPFSLVQQFNTHHPYGWNDGPMISAKGYQGMLSAGIQASLGPVELQLQPEFIFAANPPYRVSASYGANTGTNYLKLFPGQSSLQVNIGKTAIGVSTANIWWGPGVHSSLLMSNNAPGIPRVFFRSRKPVNIGIGSLEWQLMGGWLQSDFRYPFENNHLKMMSGGDTRYLNGLVVSYQPKWVPGLFLGFTRAVQTYAATNAGAPAAFFERYFPTIALAIQKKDVKDEDSLSRDQLASFFLRWVFPKAHFEFYAEYGFNDYSMNWRDYSLGTSHSAAYIVGFRKVIPRGDDKRIEFGMELTQMAQSPDWMVRNAGNWYEHSTIHEGYTNQNQIIGAGAGWGANVLSIDASWVSKNKRLGFLLERINRDPVNRPVKWIDLGLGVAPQWKKGQFVVGGLLELVKTNQYLWETGNSVLNVHSRLSVQYYLK